MLARKATKQDLDQIVRMSPGVDFGALRANHDFAGQPKDQQDVLQRLLDDGWHEVLVAHERDDIVGALILVYQRQRMSSPADIGDHLRIVHTTSQSEEKARKVLFELATALGRDKQLDKINLTYDPLPETDLALWQAIAGPSARQYAKWTPATSP